MNTDLSKEDIEYAERRWPGDAMGSVRYGYLEGVRMERDACAKIAESTERASRDGAWNGWFTCGMIAKAIRERTQP